MLFAAKSLVLTPGSPGTFQVPNKPDFRNLGPVRVELRIHNWTRPSSSSASLLNIEGLVTITLPPLPASSLAVTEWNDAFTRGQGNSALLDISGRTDFILRFQRDVQNKQITSEIWNVDGSHYISKTVSIDTVRGLNLAGASGTVGGSHTSANLAYVRVAFSTVPLGTRPISVGSYSLDLDFENSLTHPSVNHVAFKMPATYVSTPVYPPACNAGSTTTVRAGTTAKLDASGSYALDGSPQLTYSWTVINAPEPVAWVGDTQSQTVSFQPNLFGTYQFQLVVKDSSNQSSSCSVKYGSVLTDDSGIVLFSDDNLSVLFSPLLRLGASPWPWFDNRHQVLADFFGGLQTTDYKDPWNQAAAGRLSVVNNSKAVTGVGTFFQKDFCGGTKTSNGSYLVVWYPIPNVTDRFGRRTYSIASCDSDTQMTLGQPYTASGSANNLSYAHMSAQEFFIWCGSPTNANFYDSVLAFYALYYRSGIDTYRDYARNLADLWWTMPYIDEGRSCDLQGVIPCWWPRNRSMMGLVARALDGRPEMWPGFRHWCSIDSFYLGRPGPLTDIREQAYELNEVSLCALFDPNPAARDTARRAVIAGLDNNWAPNQQPAGNWTNPTYGYASWNGFPGTVSVTAGSKSVTGVNTHWTIDQFVPGYWFWVTSDPHGPPQTGDAAAYRATFKDATHLTLDRAYAGKTGSNLNWQINNLVGSGTQPFTLGVAGNAMYFAYLASGDVRARQFVLDIANWEKNRGFRAATRGLYYGRDYPGCEPIQEGLKGCAEDTLVASRAYSSEIMATLSRAYSWSLDPQLQTFGDNLFGALFGKAGFGGPQSDGLFDNEVDDGGWTMSNKKAKDFGFLFGFSQGWTWPAARLATAQNPLVNVRFVPGSAAVQATRWHVGQKSTETPLVCTADSCALDTSCAECLWKIQYLSPGKTVLAVRLLQPYAEPVSGDAKRRPRNPR